MHRVKRLGKEGVWLIAGQITSLLASLALIRLLTEYLNPFQYGQLALALTLGTLVCQVSFSGVMPGIMRFYSVALDRNNISEYFFASCRMMGYGTIVALGLSIFLLFGLALDDRTDIVVITGMAIIFTILNSYSATQNSIQNAARQRHTVAIYTSLDFVLRLLFVTLVVAYLNYSSNKIVVLSYILSGIIILYFQYSSLRKLIPTKGRSSYRTKRWMIWMWQYSRPFVYFNFFTWVQSSSDRWALEIFSNTQEVGKYVVLIQLGYMPIVMMSGLLTNFISPILFQHSGSAQDHSKNYIVYKYTWWLVIATLVLTLGFCFIAYLFHDWMFRLLVAAPYRSISYFLPLIIFASGVYSASQVFALKLMSDLNTKALIFPKIALSLLGAVCSYAGAYFAGFEGVIYGAITFSFAQLFWMGWVNWRPSKEWNKKVA